MHIPQAYAYLLVNAACIAVPLVAAFHPKLNFVKHWKALLAANLATMAVFIPWDILFTMRGYWGFNPDYLSGVYFSNLPLEEWLFFLCIPFACVFTVYCFDVLRGNALQLKFNRAMHLGMAALCIFIAFISWGRWYPFITSLLTVVVSVFFMVRPALTGPNFFLAFAVLLLPFAVSNGVLTGLNFWQYPIWNTHPEMVGQSIVWYNNAVNSGVRIWSVPVDDFLYAYLLIAMNVGWFNFFRTRWTQSVAG